VKRVKPLPARRLDVISGLKPSPEPGFHYFPSPESSDDIEIIAYQYLYCATAVDEWPGFRRWLEKTRAKSPKECDDIEANAVNVFREFRDAINTAGDTDNPALMSQPRLLDRLTHAHAYLALHADHASLGGYRRMIYPQMDDLPDSSRPQQSDFLHALWEGKWNGVGDRMPAEVTRGETHRSSRLHARDGAYNTGGRLDPLAKAQQQIDPLWAEKRIAPTFQLGEPHYKPTDEAAFLQVLPGIKRNDFLSPMKDAFTREATRQLFLQAGVKPKHASFGVRMIHDGAKQKDNPTAWKAIYRKRGEISGSEIARSLLKAKISFSC
jgi:hypothetical protein